MIGNKFLIKYKYIQISTAFKKYYYDHMDLFSKPACEKHEKHLNTFYRERVLWGGVLEFRILFFGKDKIFDFVFDF